ECCCPQSGNAPQGPSLPNDKTLTYGFTVKVPEGLGLASLAGDRESEHAVLDVHQRPGQPLGDRPGGPLGRVEYAGDLGAAFRKLDTVAVLTARLLPATSPDPSSVITAVDVRRVEPCAVLQRAEVDVLHATVCPAERREHLARLVDVEPSAAVPL